MPSEEALASVRRFNDVIRRLNAFTERTDGDPDGWSEADTQKFIELLSEFDEARVDHSYYYPRTKL